MYQYRYTDALGKRHAIYDRSLADLRKKENSVIEDSKLGIDYNEWNITMLKLVDRYLILKTSKRYNTKVNYQTVLAMLRCDPFCQRKIKDIKVSDAKLWFANLQKNGKRYCTLTNIRGVVKPAFDLAWDEEVIRRNPFSFKMTDVVVNDTVHRVALSQQEQKELLDFFRTDSWYSRYYDDIVVLLETGLRISEYCGLTKKDLDFQNKRINVDHQICREKTAGNNQYFIEPTKTESGKRIIPMTLTVEKALLNILKNRKKVKVEKIVNGYSGFINIDKNGNPKVALHYEHMFKWAREKYDKLYPNNTLPHVTPHVLRHTFCTNMSRAGMDLKALQYLMGHSDASITLNVYTHASFDHAKEELTKISVLREAK